MNKEFSKVSNKYGKNIAVGFAWIGLFMLAAKIIGASKDIAVAWRYGATEIVDIYIFIFNLVTWPVGVWFSILSVVLPPVVLSLKIHSKNELCNFQKELLGFSILIGGCGAVFLFFLAYVLSENNVWRISLEYKNAAHLILFWMSFITILGSVISLISVFLMAQINYYVTALEAMPSMGILAFLILLNSAVDIPLLWGTLIGYAAQLCILISLFKKSGGEIYPSFTFNSIGWVKFGAGFSVMMVGQIFSSATILVDQFIAAQLGQGVLAVLSYSSKILMLLMGLGSIAVSRATLPVFSNMVATGDRDVKRLTLAWTKIIFWLGCFAALIVFYFAPEIVHALFRRGEFSEIDSEKTVNLLRYSLIQLPFYLAALVLISYLAAKNLFFIISASGVMNFFTKTAFSLYFYKDFGVIGLVVSTSIMYIFSFVFILYFVLRDRDTISRETAA